MSDKLKKELLAAYEANLDLIGKIEEFEQRPDMIISANAVLYGTAKVLKLVAPAMKLTPWGWLSWVFTLGGALLEGMSKRKKGD